MLTFLVQSMIVAFDRLQVDHKNITHSPLMGKNAVQELCRTAQPCMANGRASRGNPNMPIMPIAHEAVDIVPDLPQDLLQDRNMHPCILLMLTSLHGGALHGGALHGGAPHGVPHGDGGHAPTNQR